MQASCAVGAPSSAAAGQPDATPRPDRASFPLTLWLPLFALHGARKRVEHGPEVVAPAVKVGPGADGQPELGHRVAHQRVARAPVAGVR